MRRLPSREEILTLLDRLEQEPAGALESAVLDFKSWRDAKSSMSEAVLARVLPQHEVIYLHLAVDRQVVYAAPTAGGSVAAAPVALLQPALPAPPPRRYRGRRGRWGLNRRRGR